MSWNLALPWVDGPYPFVLWHWCLPEDGGGGGGVCVQLGSLCAQAVSSLWTSSKFHLAQPALGKILSHSSQTAIEVGNLHFAVSAFVKNISTSEAF